MVEQAYDRLKQKENTGYREQMQYDARERIKAYYARFLGVESLSREQEKELWDGMSEAYWRHLVKTTNILEWLAE